MIQKEGKTITIFIPCIVKFVNAQPSKYYWPQPGYEPLFFDYPAFSLGTIPAALSHLRKMQLYYIEIGHNNFLNNMSISPRVIPLYHCTLSNMYT
jgi:hypothetical protein